MQEVAHYIRIVEAVSQAVNKMPNRIAAEAVKFSKQRFREQAWLDDRTEPWKKRKAGWLKESKRRKNRNTLIDKARLFRSIRKITANASIVEYGSVGVPYAEIHNNGGRYRVTQNVGSHTRKAHTRTREGRREEVKSHEVKPFKRSLNINMPRRRYIGPSAVLNRNLERMISADLVSAITNA